MKRGGVPWENGLREVALAAPDALSTRDKKTHLYPFMLAAIKNVNSVDTVYNLLRMLPSVLHSIMPNEEKRPCK